MSNDCIHVFVVYKDTFHRFVNLTTCNWLLQFAIDVMDTQVCEVTLEIANQIMQSTWYNKRVLIVFVTHGQYELLTKVEVITALDVLPMDTRITILNVAC